MILGSPQLLNKFQMSTLQKLEGLLIETLKWNPSDIGRVEFKQGLLWRSFVLVYLYEPYLSFNNPTKRDKYLESLNHLSINTLLNSLESDVAKGTCAIFNRTGASGLCCYGFLVCAILLTGESTSCGLSAYKSSKPSTSFSHQHLQSKSSQVESWLDKQHRQSKVIIPNILRTDLNISTIEV